MAIEVSRISGIEYREPTGAELDSIRGMRNQTPCLGLPHVVNHLRVYHEAKKAEKLHVDYLILQGLLSDAWLENAWLRRELGELQNKVDNLKKLGFEF